MKGNLESADDQTGGCSLLALPAEVLQLILDVLGPYGLADLLQTSKAMAEGVMQHRAGRLTVSVELHKGVKLGAIRQLLQWAPKSSLKLMLHGQYGAYPSQHNSKRDWGELSTLFSFPCTMLPTASSQHWQPQQQLTCITEVYIQGFTLPSLVPANLATTCPNMHTLRLISCTVHATSDSSSSMAASIDTGSTAFTTQWPAHRLHSLTLGWIQAPQFRELPFANGQYSQMPADVYIRQLRGTVPNLRCLKLLDSTFLQHVAVLGPQLQELHLYSRFERLPPEVFRHLQQLRKLVLPGTVIPPASDLPQLLSLPSLTHLEVQYSPSCVPGVLPTDDRVMVKFVCQLAAAVARQPAGRCINVAGSPYLTSFAGIAAIARQAKYVALAGVDIRVDVAQGPFEPGWSSWLCITSRP